MSTIASDHTAGHTNDRRFHSSRLASVAALLLALTACGGNGAGPTGGNNTGGQQVQIGQNLNGQPANNAIRCVDGVPAQAPAYQGFFFIPAANASTSCTLITFFDGIFGATIQNGQ